MKFKSILITIVSTVIMFSLLISCSKKPENTNISGSDSGNQEISLDLGTDDNNSNGLSADSKINASQNNSQSGSLTSGYSSNSSSSVTVNSLPQVTAKPLPSSIDMKGKTIKINLNGFDTANAMKTQSGQYLMKHVDEISKKFNCKIIMGGIDWTTIYPKMAAGDPGCDIMGVGGNLNFANSMKNNWLYPISTLGINFSQSQFDQEMQKTCLVENEYYAAIPATQGWESIMDTMAMFFNKRLVQGAGYNPDSLYTMQKNGSWNWSVFEAICKKITKDTNGDNKTDIYGVVNGYYDNYLWSSLIQSNGSDWIKSSDNKSMSFVGDSAKALAALNFWQKLAYTENLVYLTNDKSADATFIQGNAGFIPQYINRANFPAFKTMRDDWGIVYIPKGPDATRYYSAFSWFDGYSIPSVNLQNDDTNNTYGRQLAAIINELCKPHIPSNLIASLTQIQFESLVRDEGTLDTFNSIKSIKYKSDYYNGINTVGQSLNSELITQVAKGTKDVNAVISQNKVSYTKTLNDLWNFY